MTVEFAKPIDFDKTRPDFESRFPMQMAILRVGGVYPGEEASTENPYTKEMDTEYFGNVGEHCMAVAFAAEIIAERVLGENNPQTRIITERALVHDSTKRFEVMRRNAVRSGIIEDAYSPKAYETIIPVLEEKAIASDVIAYMVHAGSETGHNSFGDFVEIVDGNPTLKTERNLAEMIVHHADDMTFTPIVKAGETATTHFLTPEERMEASDFPNRYPFIYKEGFGFDSEGKLVNVKDISEDHSELQCVKSYAEWQVWIANKISGHLVNIISPEDPVENPEAYLKDLVNNALAF